MWRFRRRGQDLPNSSITELNDRSTQINEACAGPPDGGYGWVQVGVCFTVNCFTWGQVAVGYYLSSGAYHEATDLDFAFIGGFNFAMAMLVAPLVTILARKLGTQPTMAIGVLIQTAGFVSASFAWRVWQLYLSQGLLIGLGLGFIYVPSIAILSQWFSKKRSLVNGISSAGSGIGGLIFSFAIEAMIRNISLAWSFRIIAVITGIMNLTATMLIRNRNSVIRPPQLGFDTKLIRRPEVLLLLFWGFTSMLGYITLLYSLPDYASSVGLTKSQAASLAAYLNLGTAIGRPLIGVASDRFGRMEVAGLLTLFCGVTCFAIWIPATSYGVIVFFAVLNGGILGVFWMVQYS
ncbi:MAG: hypothetical protein M1830_009612 [Pleopsidium flavum]|nr:MAG: hypothetical protein M1830_009612 [Pleopsidium flavum]